jgi:hypothetical protein
MICKAQPPSVARASGVIGYVFHSMLPRTMSATVERAFGLDTVADDLTLAVLTYRGQLVNRALEAVKRVGVAGSDHLE